MKITNFTISRYDAEDGKVFDWAEPRFVDEIDEEGKPTGNQIQEHLYVKTVFVGIHDSIENYIEVEKPEEASE